MRAFFSLLLLAALQALALSPSNRIALPHGREVFLSGMNLAWINYAADVGDAVLDTHSFKMAMQDVRDSGGNVMRVWLSTNGANDPKFDPATGLVNGLGKETINNVKRMLKIAGDNGMLLMPVLLSHNLTEDPNDQKGLPLQNNLKLLTTDAGLQAYIDHAVLPLVKAIGKDTSLACWEVFNEPEGMVENIGWTKGARIQGSDVQKVVNRVAGAIHRAVPGVLVSNGAQTFATSSDVPAIGSVNWYSDSALVAVGGDQDGILDFYMVHYYPWNGAKYSPFAHPASYWNLDKPIVLGEFPAASWSKANANQPNGYHPVYDEAQIDTLYANTFDNGYAGALAWCYMGDSYDSWLGSFSTTAPAMSALFRDHAEDILIREVSRPLQTGNGVLKIAYENQDNSVWTSLKKDTTMDLSAARTLSVDVLVPKSARGSFKLHWVLKTGSSWEWDISDVYCAPKADSLWSRCTADLGAMHYYESQTLANLKQVHSLILHFGTESSFQGIVWFDNVKIDQQVLYDFDNGRPVFSVDAYSVKEASKVTSLDVGFLGSVTAVQPSSRALAYTRVETPQGFRLEFGHAAPRLVEVRDLQGALLARSLSQGASVDVKLSKNQKSILRVKPLVAQGL